MTSQPPQEHEPEVNGTANNIKVWVSSITFSDGTELTFQPTDITVIVGPNNAGKSAALRAIQSKFDLSSNQSPVITQASFDKTGDQDDFEAWITSWAVKRFDQNEGNPIFQSMGQALHRSHALNSWTFLGSEQQNHLSRWFLLHLSGEQRLSTSNPAPAIQLTTENPSHPIHYLARDDKLELKLSSQFQRAFGTDLIVHRNAGNNFPLYIGERPVPQAGEDRVSVTFLERLERLPKLHEQGDGMRSFASVLLSTSVGRENILLIDEPEAFLHPPQARLLGNTIVELAENSRQIFIATHSGDVLRGVLATANFNVRVVRIERTGSVNRVRSLSNDDIRDLWSDSLLRHSNILDGLFHEAVVVCEADSDCSFYSAILTSLGTKQARLPDVQFTHCGGKYRIAMVLRALIKVGVPAKTICDFDILSDEQPLRGIYEALGGDWHEIETDWRIVKSSVDSKRPDRSTHEVKTEVDEIFANEQSNIFSHDARRKIASVLKLTTAWSNAKLAGSSYVPSGQPSQALTKLLKTLQTRGVYVVDVGELEGFCRTVSDHGPRWVAEVLQRDLANDAELRNAREFIAKLFALQV